MPNGIRYAGTAHRNEEKKVPVQRFQQIFERAYFFVSFWVGFLKKNLILSFTWSIRHISVFKNSIFGATYEQLNCSIVMVGSGCHILFLKIVISLDLLSCVFSLFSHLCVSSEECHVHSIYVCTTEFINWIVAPIKVSLLTYLLPFQHHLDDLLTFSGWEHLVEMGGSYSVPLSLEEKNKPYR